ncbi:CBS domain-containing protein [Lichenicola cladoniae]|uniref:CBS domain-containing protein n=1 Tax=Lichenicola cladoniae TaxID=1484109 RepID=A0A6M8HL49_9PROT|nr:CBS domain-containing protein [Lichenicola cladoniae]NPD69208.1 CBS domain-containing protein [Acetobacteraceae bacterium]QKE89035.1 CBS domain-containing protein [Lichenicola cladoniae]
MLIETILKTKGHDVATLRPEQAVSAAVALMAERRIGAVVIADRGTVVGIFSERDLVKVLARDGHVALDRAVQTSMTSPVVTCRAEDRLDQVMAMMTQRHIRHMPVMDGTSLKGMISIRDLVRHRLEEKELEAAILLDISRMHG